MEYEHDVDGNLYENPLKLQDLPETRLELSKQRCSSDYYAVRVLWAFWSSLYLERLLLEWWEGCGAGLLEVEIRNQGYGWPNIS